MANGYSAIFGSIVIDGSNDRLVVTRGGAPFGDYNCDLAQGTYQTVEDLLEALETLVIITVPGDDITFSLVPTSNGNGCAVQAQSLAAFTISGGSMLPTLGMLDIDTVGLFTYQGAVCPDLTLVTPGVSMDNYATYQNTGTTTVQGTGLAIAANLSHVRRRSVSWTSLTNNQVDVLWDIYSLAATGVPLYYRDNWEYGAGSNRMQRLMVDFARSGEFGPEPKSYENSCLFDVSLEFIAQ
jgi:hypothetical protein